MASATVIATIRIEGFHRWPEAPEPVEFLRARHRHLFLVRGERHVSHVDRDTEFILLGQAMRVWLARLFGEPMELGSYSCEGLAREMLDSLTLDAVEVWEDAENGARVCR